MGNVSQRRLPAGVTFAVIAGLLAALSLYTGYRVWEARRDDVTLPARATGTTDPINVPLFVDPAGVRYGTRFNFTFDTVETLGAYRDREKLDDVVDTHEDTFDQVLDLLHWTSVQWQPGRPDPYPPIDARIILDDIRAGRTGGFCAQYNYVFVQAVQSFGIPARYVTIRRHEVTEVWIARFGKWACFDPLHDAYYADATGTPLSVHEIYTAVRAGTDVRIVGHHRNEGESERQHLDKFRSLAVWLKNDHVSQPINFADLHYHKVYFIEEGQDPAGQLAPALFTSSLSDLYFDPTAGG